MAKFLGTPTLSQIVGMQSAKRRLISDWTSGKLSHAYLLVGQKGVGKATLALAVARLVCCKSPADSQDPCGSCESCQKTATVTAAREQSQLAGYDAHVDIHPDITIIRRPEGRRDISIEAIRALRSRVSYPPVFSPFRFFVIKDADLMSHEACSSLLKVLEEPPKLVKLLLTTSRETRLLPTVRSRVRRICCIPPTPVEFQSFLESHCPASTHETIRRVAECLPGRATRLIREEEAIRRIASYSDTARELISSPRTQAWSVIDRLQSEMQGRQRTSSYSAQTAELDEFLASAERELAHQIRLHTTQERTAPMLALLRWEKTFQLAREMLAVNASPTLILDLLASGTI